MIKETLYPTTFAIYDPAIKRGEFTDRTALRRKFDNVADEYISITKTIDNNPIDWLYRTSVTRSNISKTDMNARFVKDTVLDGDLISGARLTRSDLTQLAKSNTNLLIDIQDLSRPEEAFVILCDRVRLSDDCQRAEMTEDAEDLPTFIDFFLDDRLVGVAVQALDPAATKFKLKWG